jgi:voltage-gated potassium channel
MSVRQFLAFRAEQNLQYFVASAAFNICVALLIIISVALIFAEFLAQPGPWLEKIIELNDIITWMFVFELGLRYVVAPNKKKFFENFWLDILAVLPVLRVFRTFRLFRLLRLLRLTRALVILLRQSGWLSAKIERYVGSFGVLFLTAIMLIICGTLTLLSLEQSHGSLPTNDLLGFFENKVWQTAFLFISGEVVGDLPDSHYGRFVTVLISMSGLVIFAILVGTVSASMEAYFRTKMDEKDLFLSDLNGHVVICGWDRMGALILSELETVPSLWMRGVVVIAETDEEIQNCASVKNSSRLFHVKEDFTKIEVLERVGVKKARAAVVLADKGNNLRDQDRDARTVLAALTLEKLNPKIFTCAELLEEQNATHLKIAGVEEIISRTSLTAGLFASTLVNQGISSIIGDLLSHKEGACLRKFQVPEEFVGHEFLAVFDHFKKELNATILAVDWKTETGSYERQLNPSHNRKMHNDDMLIAVTKVDSHFRDMTG